jgi:hypothetical protein
MFSLSALANMMLIFSRISNTKKRKAQPVIEISSDSSDVYVFQTQAVLYVYMCYSSEIIKAPVTPSKKRTKTSPPSPGTPEFDLLPAVSLPYAFVILILFFVLGLSIKGVNWMR